jgi:hypothetical protein
MPIGARSKQSQRGSNPCLHLERVGRYVQGVQTSAVLPGQNGCLVQPVHSIGPSIAEKMDNWMDNWMDNFRIPDASVAALSVLPDILLTSSQLAFWTQVRAHQTCRSAQRPPWRRPSFWHVVRRPSECVRSSTRVRSAAPRAPAAECGSASFAVGAGGLRACSCCCTPTETSGSHRRLEWSQRRSLQEGVPRDREHPFSTPVGL